MVSFIKTKDRKYVCFIIYRKALSDIKVFFSFYRIASLITMMGFESIKFLHEVLREPSPTWDEHITLREMRNKFAGAAKALSSGEIQIEGWRPIV